MTTLCSADSLEDSSTLSEYQMVQFCIAKTYSKSVAISSRLPRQKIEIRKSFLRHRKVSSLLTLGEAFQAWRLIRFKLLIAQVTLQQAKAMRSCTQRRKPQFSHRTCLRLMKLKQTWTVRLRQRPRTRISCCNIRLVWTNQGRIHWIKKTKKRQREGAKLIKTLSCLPSANAPRILLEVTQRRTASTSSLQLEDATQAKAK